VLFDQEQTVPDRLADIERELAALAVRENRLADEMREVAERRAALEEARALLARAGDLVTGTTKAAPTKRGRPRSRAPRAPSRAQVLQTEIEAHLQQAGEAPADQIRLAVARDDRYAGTTVYKILARLTEEGVIERLTEREGHAPIYRWLGRKPELRVP
jgi:hypothetical protein